MRKPSFLVLILVLGPLAPQAFAADTYSQTCSDCQFTTDKYRGTELSCNCYISDFVRLQQTSLLTVDIANRKRCVPGTIHNINGSLICETEPMEPAPILAGGSANCTIPGSPECLPPPPPPPISLGPNCDPAFPHLNNCTAPPPTLPPLEVPQPPPILPIIDESKLTSDPFPQIILPPGPTKVDTSRAENWEAKIHNSALFEEPVGTSQQFNANATGASKIFIQQNEAFSTHTNVLFRCAETSMSGRTDADCATFPNDPECAGMLKSLENATTCLTPPPRGSPPGTPCLTYGKFGFVMEEWLVFGQQFYNGMSTCITTRDAPGGSIPRHNRMLNLTDMASLAAVGSGVGMGGQKDTSTVTGKVKKPIDPTAMNVNVKEISAKHDDGSGYLGYEKGEVFLQSAKGTPFTKVFSESPFAEKLTSKTKELVIGSLEDSKDVIGRVKEKKLAMKEKNGEAVAGSKSTTGGKDMMAELEKVAGDSSAISVKLPSGSKKSGEKYQAMLAAANLELKKKENSTIAPELLANAEPPPPSAEPAMLAQGVEGRAPASLVSEVDQSLFERVRVSYRRYAPKMRESKTARDVRHTDSPAFFRDL